MINRKNNRSLLPSFVPKFSDPDLIRSVMNSDIWKHLFLRERKAVWIFLKAILFLKIEMFVSPIKAVLRYAHGKRTMGLIITLMTALMMLAFNTKYIVGYLATFFPLAAPILPFFMSGEQMSSAAFTEIRSPYLMYFWMGYLALSVIHLGLIYLGKGGTHLSPNKRGTSILHTVLFKHLKVSEQAVQRFIEPLLVGSTGYFLCASEVDFALGLFLIIGAFCLIFQECYDAVMRFSMNQ